MTDCGRRHEYRARPANLRRSAVAILLPLAMLALGACQSRMAVHAPPPPPPQPPSAGERFRIDAERSEVLILVYRDGPLAALGPNHVIAVRRLSGEVLAAGDPANSTVRLDFPVDALSVDEPQLRAALGPDFQSTLGATDIAGTREHMLGERLLDAARFPSVHLQSTAVRGEGDALRVTLRVVVRDHEAQLELPVTVQRSGDDLIASGEFDVTHAQLGLTPYSVALGALRVAERMQVRYRLVARRLSAAASARGLQHQQRRSLGSLDQRMVPPIEAARQVLR